MLRARVEVKGVELHYRQWGTAETPTLLLAHGLPDGGFVWTKLAEALQDHRRVLAFDLPAFGDSDRVPRGFDPTVGTYGNLLDGFVEALGLDRFDLGVHDISAAYALPYAGIRRGQVTGLALFNTQAFADWRWHALARRYRRPVLGRLMTLRPSRARFEKLLRPAFAGEPPRWYLDELWKVLRRGAARRAVMTFYRRNEPDAWGAAERSLARLKGLPSVVVWGGADRFIHTSAGERHAEALGARLVTLPDAGHFPQVEKPEACADALRSVLA